MNRSDSRDTITSPLVDAKRASSRWVRIACIFGVLSAGCDDEDAGDEAGGTTSTTAAESSESSSSGDAEVVPWSPGPGCPENTWYQCSTAPEYDWMLDANGCLLSGCTPDAEETGCPDGEECLPTEACMTLVPGCFEVDGACVCETDPTCFDYACQLPG